MESFVWHLGWEHTRPSSSVGEAGGRCPGRVPLVMAERSFARAFDAELEGVRRISAVRAEGPVDRDSRG